MDPLRIWFDPPHVRWRRVVVTVLVATVLVGLWVAQRRGVFEGAPAAAVAVKVAPAGGLDVAAVAPATSGSTQLAAAPAPARAASSAEIVCGFGVVSFDPEDEKQIDALSEELHAKLEALRVERLPIWLAQMKASPDEEVQAVAWFAQAIETWRTKVLPAVEEQGKPWAKIDVPNDGLDELARLAQRSGDPQVYGLAMHACGFLVDFSPRTACAALSFEEWARRDPDNGYPWLLASNYQAKGSARRAQLIERAMSTKELRTGWGYAYEPLSRALAPGASAQERSAIFAQAVTLTGINLMPPVSVIDHCSDDELRKDGRRTQCEYFATHLSEHSDSFMLSSFGGAIGRQLGWSKDRLDSLRQKHEAIQVAAGKQHEAQGCDGLSKIEDYLAYQSKHGELAAARRVFNSERHDTTTAKR
ncbi:MAG: hypothetical protein AB7U92_17230 [Piscinibacter sp.]|uniref:hypothetical protein n=1 Tax=Piscinibacter sp. TaxID=1903157 RepID=UPI003D134B59